MMDDILAGFVGFAIAMAIISAVGGIIAWTLDEAPFWIQRIKDKAKRRNR